uniref:Uncharacterized protein n=1 Tax=Anopheles atroparvus TaxID=41427 RepID=A0AAG5CWI3_ANOAO
MKTIFIIFCVAALANAMTVNRQQQQVPPQQVGQGGQQQARQWQDDVPDVLYPMHDRQGDDNLPSWPEIVGTVVSKVLSRQEQGQNCVDVDCEFDWQQQQVRQGGQKQIGQRQDVQPQIPAQQQFQWGQNRQQQKCLTVDCVLELRPRFPQLQTQDFRNRQQQLIPQQPFGQGGQQQVGQRQIDQIPITGQQQQQRQICNLADCPDDQVHWSAP